MKTIIRVLNLLYPLWFVLLIILFTAILTELADWYFF